MSLLTNTTLAENCVKQHVDIGQLHKFTAPAQLDGFTQRADL